tara:strand:- start:7019 stop:8584 length:1566 start_codon:yes stop_codon:yes gene_type:complete
MSNKTYKIALLSNFTVKGLDGHLKNTAAQYDINIDVYNGEYGQWQQEILGENLYAFKPDMVYMIVDFEDIDSQIKVIEQLAMSSSAKIVVCNKVGTGSDNQNLIEQFKDNSQIHVFDFDSWLASIGKKEHWNTKYKELGDMRLAPNAFEMFAQELGAYLIPLSGKTKKCLVLDLDNTLWGRIIGEDGIDGIAVSPTGEGKPYYDFQKYIKSLKNQGVVLTINSNNNEQDAKEVLKHHKHMQLREGDFASIRANWNNKAQNIQEIAIELNIGLDSMVFVDDDPRNRELVKTSLPEVGVIDLPEDPVDYIKALQSYKGFTTFGITDEDKKKSQMYFDEKKRREFKEGVIDLDSFLRGLNTSIIIQVVKEKHIGRVSQLTQKTNQFNLTTRRYQEEDIKKLVDEGAKIWVMDVKDKFGEYGLTGLAIARDQNDYWEIDTMLMSCRVLGKRVEEEFFGHVLDQLKKQGQKKVIGAYIPTVKNEQVKDFYKKFGFIKQESDNEDVWELDLKVYKHQPLDFITVRYE